MEPLLKPLAWHYTTGECFMKITNSGVLRPTDIGVRPPERPVLWFSLNQKWEQTANKLMEKDGERHRLNMEETSRHAGGLLRFGVKPEKLIPWPVLAKKAKTPKKWVRALERVALEQGARPKDWMGTLDAMPIEECERVEYMDKNGRWVGAYTI